MLSSGGYRVCKGNSQRRWGHLVSIRALVKECETASRLLVLACCVKRVKS